MYCILIAGLPAAGKSRFAEWLAVRRGLPSLSKDAVKEKLFDTVGFRSREEKVALGRAAQEIVCDTAERLMAAGLPLILENNFETSSREGILRLLERYRCIPVTVLFDGDLRTIYRRFVERDRSPERHRGHVVNTAYPEREDSPPCIPMGFEAFARGTAERGFREFDVGGVRIVVDSTDLSRLDYEAINMEITAALSAAHERKEAFQSCE